MWIHGQGEFEISLQMAMRALGDEIQKQAFNELIEWLL
jgi:hypothetical protein